MRGMAIYKAYYSEPSQKSMMELFARELQLSAINYFLKISILDFQLGCDYASGSLAISKSFIFMPNLCPFFVSKYLSLALSRNFQTYVKRIHQTSSIS